MNSPDTMQLPNSSSPMIDNAMYPTIAATKTYNEAARRASEPPPYENIYGPSTDDINSGKQRMGTFEYLARGGIENTAKKLYNTINEKRNRKKLEIEYEQLLSMGEKGADILYQDAINTYGQGITQWIPRKTAFYDKTTGAFQPHNYAEKVAYGIAMFEAKLEKERLAEQERLAKEQEQQAREQGLKTVGDIVSGANSRQDAASKIAAAGLDPSEHVDVIKTIPELPTDKDKAMTGYYNRMPKPNADRGKDLNDPKSIINDLEKRKIEYLKLKQAKQAELREMNKQDPNIDADILKEITKIDRILTGIDRQIEEENTKVKGESPLSLPSPRSQSLAAAVKNSISENIPSGFNLDEAGLTITDPNGNPQMGMFDDLVVSKVLDMMDQQGILLPGLPEDGSGRSGIIKKSISEAGLESTLEALEQIKSSQGE